MGPLRFGFLSRHLLARGDSLEYLARFVWPWLGYAYCFIVLIVYAFQNFRREDASPSRFVSNPSWRWRRFCC